MEISSVHLHSQTGRARELKFWDKVHLPPPVVCHVSDVMCHVSCVMCHVSCVTCHVSCAMCHTSCATFHVSHVPHVMCHMSCDICNFFLNIYIFLQSVWASPWRVCYQNGLPRLVLDANEWCVLPKTALTEHYKLSDLSILD